ncbi:hypothetical protein D9M72_363920 [compost metagenome]
MRRGLVRLPNKARERLVNIDHQQRRLHVALGVVQEIEGHERRDAEFESVVSTCRVRPLLQSGGKLIEILLAEKACSCSHDQLHRACGRLGVFRLKAIDKSGGAR